MLHELMCLYPIEYVFKLYGFSNLEIESMINGTSILQRQTK
jgi:hypothetical protein